MPLRVFVKGNSQVTPLYKEPYGVLYITFSKLCDYNLDASSLIYCWEVITVNGDTNYCI